MDGDMVIQRILLVTLGMFFLAISVIGILLPGLPGTPFLLLAAGCFAKSSPRLHNWLHTHKVFGPILNNWKKDRSIPKNAKRVALLMILLGALAVTLTIEHFDLKIIILGFMVIPLVIVSRLKVAKPVEAN